MKNINEFFQNYWRHIIIGVGIVVIGYFVIFNGIQTLTPAYSGQEIATQSSSTSLRTIWENPINAIYKVILWIPFKLGHHSVIFTRIAAAIIALVSAALFYFIVFSLFSHRIAILASILFVTSSGFLHASHLGTPLVLQLFGVLTLVTLAPAYILLKGRLLPMYVGATTLALLLYIPGMLWFVLVGAIVLNKRIYHAFRQLPTKHQLCIGVLVVVLLAPLIWSSIKHPSIALASLGLPASIPSWHVITERANNLLRALLWSGRGPAEIMLVGAPLLNLIEFSLLFIGIAIQFKKPRYKSNFFIVGATLFIILLIIFGGIVNYVTLTPLLCLLMASGLFYLLTQWHKVFPVNPVAHFVGTMLVFGLVAVSALFHTKAFFTAWPRSNATRAAFSHPQPTHYDTSSVKNDLVKQQTGPTF